MFSTRLAFLCMVGMLVLFPAWADEDDNIQQGMQAMENKDYEKAISLFSQAIALNPEEPSSFVWRGIAYNGKKEYDKAITDFNKAIQLDPNNPHAFYNRGNTFRDKEQYDDAIADFNE